MDAKREKPQVIRGVFLTLDRLQVGTDVRDLYKTSFLVVENLSLEL
jgi:hypothetical protein